MAPEWQAAVGRRCEARFQASRVKPCYLHQCRWFPGVIHALNEETGNFTIYYDDGDVEEEVLLRHVRAPRLWPPLPPPPRTIHRDR